MGDRVPSDIQSALNLALDGVTIVGEFTGGSLSVTFNPAEDDADAGIGAYEAVDGGFLVQYQGGSTYAGESQGYSTGAGGQRRMHWSHTFSVEFCYAVAGVPGDRLQQAKLKLMEKTVDLLEAKLNPPDGAQYAVTSERLQPPIRHPRSTGFYLQRIEITLTEHWRRS